MNRFIQLKSQLRKRHTLLHTGGGEAAFRYVSILIGQRQGAHPTFPLPALHLAACSKQKCLANGPWPPTALVRGYVPLEVTCTCPSNHPPFSVFFLSPPCAARR